MKHKDKVKIARKMLSNKEKLDRTPKFQSKAWKARKEAKHKKELSKRK